MIAAIFAVAGAVCGFVLTLLIPSQAVETAVVSSNWPSRGLVIYASPASSQVMIAESTGKTITLGRLSRDGSFSAPDLVPGSYRLIISRDGYRDYEKQIQVSNTQVTVLGFPRRIHLMGLNSQSDISR